VKLKNRVAVITGAGSGIGRAIALRFAAEGARVAIAELNQQTGGETARMITAQGGEAFAVVTDVSDAAAVAKMFKAVDDRGWEVDVLINNAGNAGPHLTPVHEISDTQWDWIVGVHLNGTFYCTREAMKRMMVRKSGAVINIASVAGLQGMEGAADYAAAKGGIIAFTKAVAREAAPFGIRVNCIAPGFVETPILNNLPPNIREAGARMTPLGRIGQPDEIASVALFLASDEASFVAGQVVSPNGGLYT